MDGQPDRRRANAVSRRAHSGRVRMAGLVLCVWHPRRHMGDRLVLVVSGPSLGKAGRHQESLQLVVFVSLGVDHMAAQP